MQRFNMNFPNKKPFFIISISKKRHLSNFNLNDHNEKGLINKKYQNSYRDVWLLCSADTKQFFHEETNVLILLYGELYDVNENTLQYLHSLYLKDGIDFVRDINGSYALFIIDLNQDINYIVTDRINSRKIFQYVDSNYYVFSNSIYSFNELNIAPDPTAIAWYLSNGAVYNNRTLLKEIKILQRATIFEVSSKGSSENSYWKYFFNYEYRNVPEKELANELNDLLVKSIGKRIRPEDNINLALSGGYDSSAILGIMKYHLKIEDVKAFAYAYGDVTHKSDAYISQLMANDCNYDFNIIPAFNNDIIGLLQENAYYSQGISNICEEINAIRFIEDEIGNKPDNSLFFGDECFGWVDEPLKSKHDAFSALRIYAFNNLNLLENILPSSYFIFLKNALMEDYERIIQRTPDFEDYFDTKNYLYLDQRISHVMTSWRDMFYSRHAKIQNPFLDNEILDFMQKLPQKHRIDKSLFKTTVTKFYPKIFQYKRAKTGNAVPDNVYSLLLTQNSYILKEWLKEGNLLDQYVPSSSVNSLIDHQENMMDTCLRKAQFLLRKASRRSKYIKTISNIFDSTSDNINKVTLLKRIFVLRLFFKHFANEKN